MPLNTCFLMFQTLTIPKPAFDRVAYPENLFKSYLAARAAWPQLP